MKNIFFFLTYCIGWCDFGSGGNSRISLETPKHSDNSHVVRHHDPPHHSVENITLLQRYPKAVDQFSHIPLENDEELEEWRSYLTV